LLVVYAATDFITGSTKLNRSLECSNAITDAKLLRCLDFREKPFG